MAESRQQIATIYAFISQLPLANGSKHTGVPLSLLLDSY